MLKEKFKVSEDGKSQMSITFNDFLKFNDGLLIDHVALRNKVNRSEAEQQIKEFISKIQYELLNQNEYELHGIGNLFKDERGNLKFRQVSSFAPDPQPTKPEEQVPDESTQAQNKTGLSPLVVKEEKSFSKPKQTITSKAPVTGKPAAKKTIPKPRPTPTSQKHDPVVPSIKLAPKKPKKQLLPIWRYVIIVVLVFVLTLVVLYFMGYLDKPANSDLPKDISLENYQTNDPTNKGRESQEPLGLEEETQSASDENTLQSDETENMQNDSVLNTDESISDEEFATIPVEDDNSTEPQTVMNEEVSQPVTAETSENNKYFHVIAASFNKQAEAHEFVLKLRSKGFVNARIVNYHNGYYRVCYNSYSSKKRALTELKVVVDKLNSKAWYLYHKE